MDYIINMKTKPNQMKKLLTTLLLTATAATVAAPAAKADAGFQSHARLFGAVERAGVPIFTNDYEACEGKWGGGMYATNIQNRRSAMLICQDNGYGRGTGNLAPFTANDLDTLRHEAQHVVQDCIAGGLADGRLEPMLGTGNRLANFDNKALSERKVNFIKRSYGREDWLIEFEAFAVAEAIGPNQIAAAIDKYCL